MPRRGITTVESVWASFGEGTAYDPLVAPTVTEGVIQREASGTTSATVNVGAASDGSGSYTYGSAVLNKGGSSSATVSGTAPGELTISNLGDDEVVVLYGTVTDDETSQEVAWYHVVDVAASGGGGGSVTLVELLDLDLETLPDEGPYTNDSGTVDITDDVSTSTLTVNYEGFRATSTGTFEFINGQGCEVVGVGAGANLGAFRLDNQITGWGYAFLQRRVIIVELFATTYSGSADGDGYLCGVGSQARHNGTTSRGVQIVRDDSNTTEDVFLRYATSTSAVASEQGRTPTTTKVQRFIVTSGDKTQWEELGTTNDTVDPGDTGVITIRSNADGIQTTSSAYSGEFWAWLGAKAEGTVNYNRIRVRAIQYADLP